VRRPGPVGALTIRRDPLAPRGRPGQQALTSPIAHGAERDPVSPRRPSRGDGRDRVGHPQQRVDRRVGGGTAVPGGVGGGQRRGLPGEGEVVQRGQDHVGLPLAGRRRLDGAQRVGGLAQGDRDPPVQRRRPGGVDLTEVPVDLRQRAGPPHSA
jgi:hypothetical protein